MEVKAARELKVISARQRVSQKHPRELAAQVARIQRACGDWGVITCVGVEQPQYFCGWTTPIFFGVVRPLKRGHTTPKKLGLFHPTQVITPQNHPRMLGAFGVSPPQNYY